MRWRMWLKQWEDSFAFEPNSELNADAVAVNIYMNIETKHYYDLICIKN